MSLSSDLISQFVKATKDEKKTKSEATVYGTITYDGRPYVKLDGSDLLTPISTTTDVKDGERVTVMIKDHTATVTGNISSPSARTDDVKEIGNQVTQFESLLAEKVTTKELDAEKARIDNLVTDNVSIKNQLTATNAQIETIKADNVTINGMLTANSGKIETLETTKLDTKIAEAVYATIENLEVVDGKFHTLESTFGDFEVLTTEKFEAVDGSIKTLTTDKLSTKDAEAKYANIDFANIGQAAIETFFSKSGMINDLVVGDGTITGKLVGVTITGDLIEGNTVKADKLVVKGSDGIYYKLNFEGGKFAEGEAVPTDSLHGSVITAESITAEKISVKDLVAFGATIGGFTITDESIYSGVKESVDNTTSGIYLDSSGQMAVGNASNFIKFHKDQNGEYKLEISMVNDLRDELDNIEIGGRNLIRNSTNLLFENYYFLMTVDHDDDGNVVVNYTNVVAEYDDEGNVIIAGNLTATYDDEGNVTLSSREDELYA